MKRVLIVLGGMLISATPLIVLVVTVYTLILPNIYQSSVRISVSQDSPEINPFSNSGTADLAYNSYFLRTQFEMITSKPVLYEVIKRLNLQSEWGKDSGKLPREVAYKILRNSVQVFQLRDTSLIVISVKREYPDEAADIANEIAVTYRDSRMDLAMKSARGALEKIDEAIKEQALRVEAAEEKLHKIRVELNVPADAKPEDIQSEKYRPYRRAVKDLDTEDFIYGQLKAKHRQEIIRLEVPRNPVEIIDIAEPNRRPVSPNLFMNVLLAICLAGVSGVFGGILLALGVRKSRA